MIRGFHGLKSRSENVESKIKELEDKYDLILPAIFRQFVTWFDVGDGLFINEKYYVDTYDEYYHCSYHKFPTEIDFELDSFLSLEDIFVHWKNGIGYGEEDYDHGYIRIATINRGGAIFVGREANDLEKIIVNIWDFDPCYFELADNIMEFIKKIEIAPIPEEDLVDGIVYNQLYKNWDENFWRVRENQRH